MKPSGHCIVSVRIEVYLTEEQLQAVLKKKFLYREKLKFNKIIGR